MRASIWLIGSLFFLSGCTSVRLENGTLTQARTISDLQYRQVLDNLAMFVANSQTLPWHVKLKGGTVQITDLFAGSLDGTLGAGRGSTFSPMANAQRTVLGQWDVEPAVDADEIEALQLAYQKAVLPFDKNVDINIRFQIWQLALTYKFAPGAHVVIQILEDAVEDRFEELNRRALRSNIDPSMRALVASHLTDAAKTLVQLLDTQLTIRLPKINDDDALLLLTEHLDKPRLSAHRVKLPPAFPPELKQYAQDFDALVDRYIFDISRAVEYLQAAEIDQRGPLLDGLKYMLDEEALRGSLQYVNPVRAQKISDVQTKKQAKDKGRQEGDLAKRKGSEKSGSYTEIADEAEDGLRAFLQAIYALKYLVPPVVGADPRNAGLADQAQQKVLTLRDLLTGEESGMPWFCAGGKHDVPKCACYVGHYEGCGRDVYVWVLPENLKKLSDFTVAIQTLAPIEKQDSLIGSPGGASYSPGTAPR